MGFWLGLPKDSTRKHAERKTDFPGCYNFVPQAFICSLLDHLDGRFEIHLPTPYGGGVGGCPGWAFWIFGRFHAWAFWIVLWLKTPFLDVSRRMVHFLSRNFSLNRSLSLSKTHLKFEELPKCTLFEGSDPVYTRKKKHWLGSRKTVLESKETPNLRDRFTRGE